MTKQERIKLITMTILIATASIFASAGFAAEKPQVIYDFPITRIIDGDTVAFEANFLPEPLKQELSIRVFGVDTPEKSWRGSCDAEKALGDEAAKSLIATNEHIALDGKALFVDVVDSNNLAAGAKVYLIGYQS